jgi:hypothetical protein
MRADGAGGAKPCAARVCAEGAFWRIIFFSRLYVYLKMPPLIRKPLPRGPLRAPGGAFDRLNFLVEIN